jgi:transcription elongation factor GreB
MSRAFVAESDSQFQDEEAPEIKIPLPPGAANYMTPAGAQALRAELSALRGGERPQAAAAVTRLGASGAFSDRDELAVQRRRLREIDRRIEYLSRMLARLGRSPGDTVQLRLPEEVQKLRILDVEYS